MSSKRDQLEEKSTGARNDYLLGLAAANAHQRRYFLVDLQQAMQVLQIYPLLKVYNPNILLTIYTYFLNVDYGKRRVRQGSRLPYAHISNGTTNVFSYPSILYQDKGSSSTGENI